jgi:hypothetical protein
MSYTVKQLFADLRAGVYTSIGSYPTYFWTKQGETVSHAGVRAELLSYARATRDGKPRGDFGPIAGIEANWENPNLICDVTFERIPSAYAEPEETGT